jgi:hypothetical protein
MLLGLLAFGVLSGYLISGRSYFALALGSVITAAGAAVLLAWQGYGVAFSIAAVLATLVLQQTTFAAAFVIRGRRTPPA